MKYIYTNNSTILATVLLATKNQEYVTTLVLAPGATKELDYPGLNMYVPSPLSCYTIDVSPAVVPAVVPVIVETPVPVLETVEIVQPEPAITLISELVSEGPELTEAEIADVTGEPVADINFELVPPPAPSIEIVKTAKPVAKAKPGKKN